MQRDAESRASEQKKGKKEKKKTKKEEETRKPASGEREKTSSEQKGLKESEEEPQATVELETEVPEIKTFERDENRRVAVARSEYEATPEEIRREWPKERRFWLESLKRLEGLIKKHPCSNWLKRTLFNYCMDVANVMMEAKRVNVELEEGNRLDYDDIIDELNRIRIDFFDTQPNLASKLSTKIGELL